MDNELNRSVRILGDSVSLQGSKIFKKGLFQVQKTKSPYNANNSFRLPEEISDLNESTYNKRIFVDSTVMGIVNQNMTSTGSVLEAIQPWENTFNSLYIEFLEVLQSYPNSQAAIDMISDLVRCCSDALNVVKALKSKVSIQQADIEETWLENEQNTWRLMFVLYQDRLGIQSSQCEEDQYSQYFGLSEKLCIANLFKRDPLVRETQLIIDWLESNAAEKDDELLHFSDSTVGWENTLHQLKSRDTIVFTSSREIITKLDPDAPSYQNKPLHDLDIEDEKRLCQHIFTGIRCGKLSEVQKLCKQCGHAWKAALFEGWKLYHDPKKEIANKTDNDDHMDKEYSFSTEIKDHGDIDDDKKVEGNENRDFWKIMAFKYCEQVHLTKYEKASLATYCGYLRYLLPACNNWNDQLWAYLKVMVDVRVESEIRDCVNREYEDLPEFYWQQKMSLNEIFDKLDTSSDKTVRLEAQKPEHIIQKCLILDEIPEIFKELERCIDGGNVSSQFLRFAAHLVLFFEQIGRAQDRDVIEKVLEAYVTKLMNMDDVQLVSFYVSKMSSAKQVQLYSQYLERIMNDNDRRESLKYAENWGLNIDVITKTVVENIRSKPFDVGDMSLQQRLTPGDEYKISSIDWLLFYEHHRAEALIQSNALIFKFMMINKLDAAQLLFNKIPSDSVDKIVAEGEVADNIKQAVREHLSYKSYFDAQEAFNVWFKHFKSKPIPPEMVPDSAHLSEKVAYQHRMSQFRAESERWKLTMSHLAKSAKTLLYNVLLFPDGGWLNGAYDADYLRSICVPECVLLLATVLLESKLLNECVQLVDILASENYGLYKVYTKQKLEEILIKLTECSVALLEEKKDPWGNDTAL